MRFTPSRAPESSFPRTSGRGDGPKLVTRTLTDALAQVPSIACEARERLPRELSWIPDLVQGSFFAPCDVHSTGSKGEQRNMFSIGMRRSLCPACALDARATDTIQVRGSDEETLRPIVFEHVRDGAHVVTARPNPSRRSTQQTTVPA